MTKLTAKHEHQLFIALPIRLGEDSSAVDWCMARCGYHEVTEENFEEAFEAIKNMMYEEFPPAPSPSW